MEKFIFVSLNQSKTFDLRILRKMLILIHLTKSSEYAATDTPTSTKSGIENENILLQHNDKIHTARTFATFFSYIGHKLFYVLYSMVRM